MTELEQKAIDALKTFLSAQTEAGFDAAREEARAVIEEAEYARAEPVNARLVEALKRCRFDSFNMSLADLEFCRSALAAAEAQQAEPVNERVIDRTWARFCGAFGDGPDAPYPGMIEAFETHYGQSFRDKDWRTEAACWAAAWHKAVLVANPQAEPVRLTDEQWDEFIKHIRETYLNRPIPLSGLVRKIQKEVLRANGFKVED